MLHNRLTPDRKLLRKQFPVAVIRNRSMPDRKPLANSFLSLCCTIVSRRIGNFYANSFLSVYYTIVPYRTGNYPQTVSCRYDKQSFHVGQETFRKQFPAAMISNRSMSDRKLFANSFLPRLYAIVPCRTGNYTQTVSCRGYTQLSHDEQETFRKQFPAVMNHIRVPPDILIPPWTLRFSGPAEYPP